MTGEQSTNHVQEYEPKRQALYLAGLLPLEEPDKVRETISLLSKIVDAMEDQPRDSAG